MNLHTKEEVSALIEKAYSLEVTPDELWIAISRLTNVREAEVVRLQRIKEDYEKLEEKYRSDNAGELQNVPPNMGDDGS
jgi:hypothetical protein